MKTNKSIVAIGMCVAVVTFAGCSKSSTPTPDVSTGPATNTTTAADAVKDLTGKATDAAKDLAGQAVAAATNAVSAVTGPFNDGIAAAKK